MKKLINEATGLLKPDSRTPGEQPTTNTSPVEASSAPLMPSFSTKITAPKSGAALKSPTKTTQVKEMANAKEAKPVDEMADATKMLEGMNRIMNRTTVDEQAIKSKDVQKPEEVTTLLTLGSPKTNTNKSSSEDEGLGDALQHLLEEEGTPPIVRNSASPLPSLGKESIDYFSDNAVDVDYGTDEEDLLEVHEQDTQQNNQPLGIQSQDIQHNNQPSGTQETRTQTV